MKRCIELEEKLGDEIVFKFKAMEHIVILCMKLNKHDEMISSHDSLLKTINKIGVNDVSDAVNNILDSASRLISTDD
jgi:hypothetical protein